MNKIEVLSLLIQVRALAVELSAESEVTAKAAHTAAGWPEGQAALEGEAKGLKRAADALHRILDQAQR